MPRAALGRAAFNSPLTVDCGRRTGGVKRPEPRTGFRWGGLAIDIQID